MEKLYDRLIRQYPVQKTLRFELKPIGKTNENIEKNGILKEDEHRAEIYKKVKEYCDEYHKAFIEQSLKNAKLNNLNDYYYLSSIKEKDEKQLDELEKCKEELRKEIVEYFKKNENYSGLFKKDLIQSYLVAMFETEKEKITDINEFKNFTSYFTGFNQNRQNMYTDEEKSTAIAYRLVNENLPTFISNMKIFESIEKYIPDAIEKVHNELEAYIQTENINDIFKIDYYNDVLTEIGIENYNIIISGRALNDKKIKGLNEYINEYNQKAQNKIPKLKELYKQILSDKTSASFKYETIENDKDLIDMVNNYYSKFIELFDNNTPQNLEYLLEHLCDYNLNLMYINNGSDLTGISNAVYEDWNYIQDCISNDYDNNYLGRAKTGTEKYNEEKKKYLKGKKEYSINFLISILKDKEILSYFENYITNNNVLDVIKEKYNLFKKISFDSAEPKNIISNESKAIVVKELLDEMKKVQEFVKVLIPKTKETEKDDRFYGEILPIYDLLLDIIPVYNKARNYITQKPYSTEKIKLNFECPTLLNGWDVNKQKDNLGVIFIRNNNYYLGILNPKYKNVFDQEDNKGDNFGYRKMEYKLLPGANKMLPKVFFSNKGLETYKPSQEILDIYKAGVFKKGEFFNLEACHKLINFYKKAINMNDDWTCFNFVFKNTEQYNDISEFYRDIEDQGYKVSYTNWSEEYINSLVDANKLYLFQIYNKDFSEFSKGTPNLHTLYWKAVFSEVNLKNIVYKLNGEAEIFYRKSSINSLKPTHEANLPIKNKNDNNDKKESVFTYDLIKDRRYTINKYQFHVPITMNFKNEGRNYLNGIVNKYLKNNDDFHIIGIDRGERNLLYISLINNKGEILKQESLNVITNSYKDNTYITNYHDLLDKKEKERDVARKNWKSIENIKELKEGYMSQVINKITEYMNQYSNCLIVIEDLNKGFKNSRIKVEKQVYQKFEKMLIDKLNYLVYKNKNHNDQGGLYNAYQLTNKFDSFSKLGRQTGILFYIPAWCTSKIDPTTGFINAFYIKNQTLESSKEFINKFEDIRFNMNEDYFEFDIDYNKFTDRLNDTRRFWTICTYGERIKNFRNPIKNNEYDNERINVTTAFKELFKEYNIDYNNIKEEIIEKADSRFFNATKEKDGIEGFIRLFKLTVQMRNSITNDTEDYLISPIKNKYGKFFNTKEGIRTLPLDADANGAYNIARKGLMLINQLKKSDADNIEKIKYNITNKEWLNFVQNGDF